MSAKLRVLVIGGYGEFGGRLTQLLLQDGHHVIVAGRSLEKATRFTDQHGGSAVELDIDTDLHIIETLNVNAVVDAAGPYQTYGEDESRYRVAKQAIECGAHYLDLSDDGAFSDGITCLDAAAKRKGLFVLSGASTTPAISGAAVAQLQTGLLTIDKIETSILPGSRAPQGRSVMIAILDQVGNPIPFWRNGQWEDHNGWSHPVKKSIGAAIKRDANLIMAADALLFPQYFNTKTVLFRAGLELSIMHKALQLLGSLRARGLTPNLSRFVAPLRWMANRLTPLGQDTGGMLVEVTGQHDSASKPQPKDMLVHRSWMLEAGPGQGPNVPAIPARALLRKVDNIPIGARPCIDELSLDECQQAMQGLGIRTQFSETSFTYLFAETLPQQWDKLPDSIRASHAVIDRKRLTGTAKITRGSSWLMQAVALIFRFPKAAQSVPVTVTKTRTNNTEIWVRDFNGQCFKSTLRSLQNDTLQATENIIEEQFGLLKFRLHLELSEQALHYRVLRGSCFGIPIPGVLLPVSNTREFEENGIMHFRVELLGPVKLGLIVRYEGWLE